MNIKRELNAYSVKIHSAAEQMRKAERDYIDLAFKHRKEYELPLPEDCECESWEEYVETEDFDYSTLPCYTNIWDRYGGCHEVYITSVYKGRYSLEVCGYDLTNGEYICGWDADNYGDIIDFIQAVLDGEEDVQEDPANPRSYDIDLPSVERFGDKLTAEDFDSIMEEFAQAGFNVTWEALYHNYSAWLGDLKSGYRDEKNGYHLFSPCGCNPLSFRVSELRDDCSDWQTTYEW